MSIILTFNYIKEILKKKPRTNKPRFKTHVELGSRITVTKAPPLSFSALYFKLLREAVLANQFWQQQPALNFA